MSWRFGPGTRGGAVPATPPGPMSGQTGGVSPAEAPSPNHWRSFFVCGFLAVAIGVVFGQTLHSEFVNYDDDVYVMETQPSLRG